MRKIASIILLTLLCMNIFIIGSVAAQSTEKVPVIISFKDKSDAALIRAYGGDIKFEYKLISAIACSLPEQAIEALKRNPNIEKIEPDGTVYAIQQTLEWGVDQIDAELVHPYNTGLGIKVAVIDTGIDYTHPDLNDNYQGGVDYVNGDNDPWDDNGHGTHCAGIIAAENNDIGVVGVAPNAHLYAVKILDSSGSGSESGLIAGIEWAVQNGIQIVSMSLGADGASSSLEAACNAAEDAGVLLVAAAGNDYRGNKRVEWDTVDYPGRFASVIAVGATDQNNLKASFSSTGPDVEIAAPGVEIRSTYPGGSYATASGTSMATPHVAGVAALIFASGVESAIEVRGVLQATADDLGSVGRDYWYGYGLVDADEAAPGSTEDTVPPTISELTPSDGSVTNDATPTISAKVLDSSGIDENTIVMKLNDALISHTFDGAIVSYDVPSTLSEGSHAVSLAVSDIIGNEATAFWSFNVDTVAPQQVTELTVTVTSSSQLDLEWTTVSDAVEYKIYRTDGFIATTTTTSYSDTGLEPSTTYSYTVTAVDLAGNEGPDSETVSATTLDAPATPEMIADIEVTLSTRSAGPNRFYSATATIKVTYNEGTALSGATVYGHWESATSDSDMGTTDTSGIVVFSSDSVKNPPNGTTFTFVIDDVVLTGYDYQPTQPQSGSATV